MNKPTTGKFPAMPRLAASLGALLILTVWAVMPAAAFAEAGTAVEEPSPLYRAFESRYEEVRAAVKRGALPGEAGNRAEELWLSLRKDLISRNARIDILKLEASQYSGDRQQRALDALIRETADREGMIANYLGKLDRIATRGGSEDSVVAVPEMRRDVTSEPVAEKAAPVKTKPRAEASTSEPESEEKKSKWKTYNVKDLEIEIGPEDIVKEEQWMD